MIGGQTFCSRLAHERDEIMAGTAVRAQAYVFLPVPKKLWRETELNLAWAQPADLEAIRAARKEGVVTRLYDPPDDAAGTAVILVHTAPGVAPPVALEALLAAFAPRWPAVEPGGARIAICTHGTRDRCCAKWGFAAFREARRLFETGASPFRPVESSHLGGDRFAATGVVFPAGGMYAHLDSADLAALLSGEAQGRITPAGYRGGVFESQLAQIVRGGLAREHLFNDSGARLRVTRTEETPHRALARAGEAVFEVELETIEVTFFGSCEALAGQRASRGRRLRYVGARRLGTAAG